MFQKLAFDEVPSVTWGQWKLPSAHRKNVRGVLQFGAQRRPLSGRSARASWPW